MADQDKMAAPISPDDVLIEPGMVQGVRTQILLQGDEGLADRLQREEFDKKYDRNRAEAQVARKDVPLARFVQTEEEARQQKEALRRHEESKRTADADEAYAKAIMKQESLKENETTENEEDLRLAKQIESEEREKLLKTQQSNIDDDARIASELQRNELIASKKERIKRETDDMSYARQLQNNERRLAELISAERRLRRHHQETTEQNNLIDLDNQNDEPNRRLRTTRLESEENETGGNLFDIDEEQQMNHDREMARSLQELEMEQQRATACLVDEYDVVSSDARLARILQEKERLKAMMRQEQKRIQRAERERQQRQRLVRERNVGSSDVRQPPPYDSVPPHYDQQSSLSPSASIPAPSPAPPLLSDDRRRRRQTDQAPVSSPSASAVAAQSGYRAPASNRPERPPPPSDYLRQRGDNRQRDDADYSGRAPVTGPLYIGPVGRSVSSGSRPANNGRGASVPQLRRAATSPDRRRPTEY